MGNFTSCCSTVNVIELQTAKLIDFNGTIQRVKVPITAAELMLEQPGHFISPAEDLRRTLRYSALKADEELSAGKLYMLVPTSRLHSKASVAEMAVLESACQKRRPKRRSAKVLPAAAEVVCDDEEEEREGGFGLLGENDTGVPGCRLGVNYNRQWRPALEPICEGI